MMQVQAQKIWVVEKGKYAILFSANTNLITPVYCSVSGDEAALQLHFDGEGISPSLIQMLSASTALGQAIRSFHTVCAKGYTAIGRAGHSYGHIPIYLQEIEAASNVTCNLQFREPDGNIRTIQVESNIETDKGISFPLFNIYGDETVKMRITPRDIIQVASDFLHAAYKP